MHGNFAVEHHGDPNRSRISARQLDVQPAAGHPVLGEHLLGGDVEFADVVIAVVEEIADLLERHRRSGGSDVSVVARER